MTLDSFCWLAGVLAPCPASGPEDLFGGPAISRRRAPPCSISSQTIIEYLGQPHAGPFKLLIHDGQCLRFVAVGQCPGML
jgi:hypothetical protein